MLLIILAFAITFGVVFYLVNKAYPTVEGESRRLHREKVEKMSPKLDKMFIDVPVNKLILLDIASPLLTGSIAYAFSKNIWVALVAALLGLLIPMIVIKVLEAKRRRKFALQLVDALMILSSCLKVGMSLQQSFEVLTAEMPAPISQEFGLVLRQMQMGFSLEDAMIALKKRMKLDELDIIVTSLLVSKETGGNITETFTNVAFTIQERNKVIGKVKALTIQAKLQGLIMSLIPIAFAIFIYKQDPHFFDIFFKDNFGKMLLGYAIVSQIIGSYLIIKLSKVDV